MRTYLRISLALLIALGVSSTAAAQPARDRVSLNASVGPSFANLGTTWSTSADLNVALNDRVAVLAEFGALPHAPYRDAMEVAPPASGSDSMRLNAYHWNGNLKVQPFSFRNVSSYVTAGVGSFISDAVSDTSRVDGLAVRDYRRISDFATNVGAGVRYRINRWLGVGADYRTFFVRRDGDDPRVHRFTTGISLSLQ